MIRPRLRLACTLSCLTLRLGVAGALALGAFLAPAPDVQAEITARNAPAPVPKPVPPAPIALSREDVDRLETLLKTAKRGHWDHAAAQAAEVDNPLARKIVTWLRLMDAGSEARFEEIAAFMAANPRWPLQERLTRRAEEAMPPDFPATEVLAWFEARAPETGDGMLRLGEAHLRLGNREEGTRWVKAAWRSPSLSRKGESTIRDNHGRLLAKEDHEARFDELLWNGDRSGVNRMQQFVSDDLKHLGEARMRLRHSSRGVDSAIGRVPAHLQNHPGLLYERIRWRRRKGRHSDTWDLLLGVRGDASQHGDLDRWWVERHVQARNALQAGEYQAAYDFASNHGMTRGGSFAEAEWLSGWIALQFLDDPQTAYRHFSHLTENVTYPISKSRGLYWTGRALEASGDAPGALANYTAAAEFSETYYGQLARERLGKLAPGTDMVLRLPLTPGPALLDKTAFMRTELARAAVVAADFAEDWVVRNFLIHMGDLADTPMDLALVADLARDLDYMHYSVRIAKRAAQRYLPITDYAYPVLDLPPYQGRGQEPERALILALMRQESEFHTTARSHAAARGLMQLISGTARSTARKHGFIYRRSWLTSKPSYNSQLGRAHMADLLEQFDGSYIMALAAYNAGAHRVTRWTREFGDPRESGVDAVDWVERIPFSETRNYVQRIMETLPIYRNLLSGRDHVVNLAEDLERSARRMPTMKSVAPAQPRTVQFIPLAPKDRSNSLFGIISPAVAAPEDHGAAPSGPAPSSSDPHPGQPQRDAVLEDETRRTDPLLPVLAPRDRLVTAQRHPAETDAMPHPLPAPQSGEASTGPLPVLFTGGASAR